MATSPSMTIGLFRPVVIAGPSGSGKSTLLHKLINEYPDKIAHSVSHTTRKPREGEIDGKHYHFTNFEDMKKEIAEGKFIETAQYSGNMYGTSKAAVNKIVEEGKICILDVDVNGVRQIKKTELNPWYLFINPPSLTVLEERLRGRRSETEESLKKRLEVATLEMEYGMTPGNFDKIIVNDCLEDAYQELKEFVSKNVLKNNV